MAVPSGVTADSLEQRRHPRRDGPGRDAPFPRGRQDQRSGGRARGHTLKAVGTPIKPTNDLPATVNRSQDLTLTWTGGGATDQVEVVGYSGLVVGGTSASPTYDSGVFICTGAASKGPLTVPKSVLAQLPVTPTDVTLGGSALMLLSATVPSGSNGLFTAPLMAGGACCPALTSPPAARKTRRSTSAYENNVGFFLCHSVACS